MSSEDNTCDLGSAKFEALEAVLVRCAHTELLLKVIGINNKTKSLLSLLIGVVRPETFQRLEGIFVAADADKVPGGVGSPEQKRDEKSGPEPLKSKGNSVRPRGSVVDESSHYTGGDELTDDEAHL